MKLQVDRRIQDQEEEQQQNQQQQQEKQQHTCLSLPHQEKHQQKQKQQQQQQRQPQLENSRDQSGNEKVSFRKVEVDQQEQQSSISQYQTQGEQRRRRQRQYKYTTASYNTFIMTTTKLPWLFLCFLLSFAVALFHLLSFLLKGDVDPPNTVYVFAALPPNHENDLLIKSIRMAFTTSSSSQTSSSYQQSQWYRQQQQGEQQQRRLQTQQLQQQQSPESSSFSSSFYSVKQEHEATFEFKPIFLDLQGQRLFVRTNGCGWRRFNELVDRHQEHLATELFKYCALRTALSLKSSNTKGAAFTSSTGAVFLDLNSASPLLVELGLFLKQSQQQYNHYSGRRQFQSSTNNNNNAATPSIAVVTDPDKSIHSSFLYLMPQHLSVANEMMHTLIQTPILMLEASPLLLSNKLYDLIMSLSSSSSYQNDWYLLQQTCRIHSIERSTDYQPTSPHSPSSSVVHTCPMNDEFCCSVYDTDHDQVVFMNRYPLMPYQKIITKDRPRALTAGRAGGQRIKLDHELPYISTLHLKKQFTRPKNNESELTPNLYDIMQQKEILPGSTCCQCLHAKKCLDYEELCPEFIQAICTLNAPEKHISKVFVLSPPWYRKDPSRLIPRIVHQTWYEPLTQSEYPNMSRLAQSFQAASARGWEYRFYTDEDAVLFLQTHFPSEVLEAYQSLIPGAFKADLFRYCALLIYGGVYADVDIVLESNLDAVVEPDVGFMVPLDEPDACVWQGFIASAPGHPFLLKAVETIVNQVRNRFTGIDIDATFCPRPKFKVLHPFDILFTAGPCLLGASINRVLGRPAQEVFYPGELFPVKNNKGADFVSVFSDYAAAETKIPGRTIMLKQNKWDMNAHRFTMIENNIIVAATDLQDSDDRLNRKRAETAEKVENENAVEEKGDELLNEQEQEEKEREQKKEVKKDDPAAVAESTQDTQVEDAKVSSPKDDVTVEKDSINTQEGMNNAADEKDNERDSFLKEKGGKQKGEMQNVDPSLVEPTKYKQMIDASKDAEDSDVKVKKDSIDTQEDLDDNFFDKNNEGRAGKRRDFVNHENNGNDEGKKDYRSKLAADSKSGNEEANDRVDGQDDVDQKLRDNGENEVDDDDDDDEESDGEEDENGQSDEDAEDDMGEKNESPDEKQDSVKLIHEMAGKKVASEDEVDENNAGNKGDEDHESVEKKVDGSGNNKVEGGEVAFKDEAGENDAGSEGDEDDEDENNEPADKKVDGSGNHGLEGGEVASRDEVDENEAGNKVDGGVDENNESIHGKNEMERKVDVPNQEDDKNEEGDTGSQDDLDKKHNTFDTKKGDNGKSVVGGEDDGSDDEDDENDVGHKGDGDNTDENSDFKKAAKRKSTAKRQVGTDSILSSDKKKYTLKRDLKTLKKKGRKNKKDKKVKSGDGHVKEAPSVDPDILDEVAAKEEEKSKEDDSNDEDGSESVENPAAEEEEEESDHYSKAHARFGVYGLENLYVNQIRANEEIRFVLNAQRLWSMSSSIQKKDKLLNPQAKTA